MPHVPGLDLRHAPPAATRVGARGIHAVSRRHVVTVLRLVVSNRGTIVFGEAIGAETLRRRRFGGWRGLAGSIGAVVAGAADPPSDDRARSSGEH
jgi:hypothetical protein